jgi:hypothetical protein
MTRKTLLRASLGMPLTCGAPAAVFTWDAGGDGVNWGDPSNWNAKTLPGAAGLVLRTGNGGTSSPDQKGCQLALGVPSRICRAQSTM